MIWILRDFATHFIGNFASGIFTTAISEEGVTEKGSRNVQELVAKLRKIDVALARDYIISNYS